MSSNDVFGAVAVRAVRSDLGGGQALEGNSCLDRLGYRVVDGDYHVLLTVGSRGGKGSATGADNRLISLVDELCGEGVLLTWHQITKRHSVDYSCASNDLATIQASLGSNLRIQIRGSRNLGLLGNSGGLGRSLRGSLLRSGLLRHLTIDSLSGVVDVLVSCNDIRGAIPCGTVGGDLGGSQTLESDGRLNRRGDIAIDGNQYLLLTVSRCRGKGHRAVTNNCVIRLIHKASREGVFLTRHKVLVGNGVNNSCTCNNLVAIQACLSTDSRI